MDNDKISQASSSEQRPYLHNRNVQCCAGRIAEASSSRQLDAEFLSLYSDSDDSEHRWARSLRHA